jgi:hypothetical protein
MARISELKTSVLKRMKKLILNRLSMTIRLGKFDTVWQ